MKAIINNKIYDTEKAKIIYNYRRKYYTNSIFLPKGYVHSHWAEVTVYKTKLNNYFLYVEEKEKTYIEEISADELKEIIKELDPDKYLELFGNLEIEEA